MPPASRLTDLHSCPIHGAGPVTANVVTNVLIGFLPAATVTTILICPPTPDVVVKGSSTVIIRGLEAARIGDPCAHGGALIMGWPTVIFGG